MTQTTTTQNELIENYKRDGFIVLRGLFGAQEIQAWQRECERLLHEDWIDPQNIRTPFRMNATSAPERIEPVVDVSPLFSKLVAMRASGVLCAKSSAMNRCYSKTN